MATGFFLKKNKHYARVRRLPSVDLRTEIAAAEMAGCERAEATSRAFSTYSLARLNAPIHALLPPLLLLVLRSSNVNALLLVTTVKNPGLVISLTTVVGLANWISSLAAPRVSCAETTRRRPLVVTSRTRLRFLFVKSFEIIP